MFQKILYPTDFSDVANKAFDYVKHLRNMGAEEVIILHVIDSRFFDAMAWYSPKNIHAIAKDLEDRVKMDVLSVEEDLRISGFKVSTRIEKGNPSSEILRVAQKEAVSVIVIGSHGMSNIEEMLIGSVSEKVIRKAHCPVLVVKR